GGRLNAQGEHIGAPALRRRRVGRLGRGEARRKAKCAGGDAGFQDVTTVHLGSPSPMAVVPGGGRRPVGGTVRAIPDRSASHAIAVCTGWAENCRAGWLPSTGARGARPPPKKGKGQPAPHRATQSMGAPAL